MSLAGSLNPIPIPIRHSPPLRANLLPSAMYLQLEGHKAMQTTSSMRLNADYWLQTLDYRLQSSVFRLLKLQTANCQLRTVALSALSHKANSID